MRLVLIGTHCFWTLNVNLILERTKQVLLLLHSEARLACLDARLHDRVLSRQLQRTKILDGKACNKKYLLVLATSIKIIYLDSGDATANEKERSIC